MGGGAAKGSGERVGWVGGCSSCWCRCRRDGDSTPGPGACPGEVGEVARGVGDAGSGVVVVDDML